MKTFIRPMKAESVEPADVRFPVIVQPKLDGVRGLVTNSGLRTRTLKPFANRNLQAKFANPLFCWLDGELWTNKENLRPVSQSLCRDTTSCVNTIFANADNIQFTVFDFISPDILAKDLPYRDRLGLLSDHVFWLREHGFGFISQIQSTLVLELDHLLAIEESALSMGYEGLILRDPNGSYKNGRSTIREGGLLRIKRFTDSEAVVLELIEAEENLNIATQNELGYMERSSHSDNKIGKNMLGSLICRDVETGAIITVGPGEMTHADRIFYWKNSAKILNKIITYKSFKHGVKDKPRFPTFKQIRENLI